MRGWLEAGIVADLADILAFATDHGRTTRPWARWSSIALAGAAAVAGLWAAPRLGAEDG